ncbi:unnamed protein product, partial [Polarella glacialis]
MRASPQGLADELPMELSVSDAELFRIFDSLKGTQDLFVQIIRCLHDGTEKVVARTATCVLGDLLPTWNEQFIVRRGGGKALKFRVFAEHFWRSDVLCGEAILDAITLEQAFSSGSVQGMELSLQKKGECTGQLHIFAGKSKSATALPGVFPSADELAGGSGVAEQLKLLLFRPEELEVYVRQLFGDVARRQGRSGLPAVGLAEVEQLAQQLTQRLRAAAESFGDLQQMFWRFEVTGEGVLYEDEALRLVLYMLRQYRDAVSPPRRQAVQLGIKHKNIADSYDVVKELGRGGQGIVYLASDKVSNQDVVVKRYGKTNQKQAEEEITQEFELLMSLRHPKIARVFDIFQDWDNIYLVQEPYFGGDLTTAVQKAHAAGITVDERWMARVFLQIFIGVEFLHKNGVVHSDLKEPNVMVASSEDWERPQVIVIDFGLANKFSAKSGVGGTPGYMPPEVWDHGLWTPRGDVFSVGVMMFALRTGRSPFNPDGRASLDEVARITRTVIPQMEQGSADVIRLVDSMLLKPFLERPTIAQIMKDPWFQSEDSGQRVDTKALALLAGRKHRTDLYKALLADMASRKNMAQLKELNELFVRLDTNNDGLISDTELREGLAGTWRNTDVEKLLFALLGPEGHGEVSYDEFMGELLAAKAPEENAFLEEAFREADVDHRGYLDRAAIVRMASRPAVQQVLGIGGADGGFVDPDALMGRLDLNHDGRITYAEFKQVVFGVSTGSGNSPGFRSHRNEPSESEFQEGQRAEYWSRSHKQWMSCRILAVGENNAVQVDCKPGIWITGPDLSLVRPPLRMQLNGAATSLGASTPFAGPQYFVGQAALFWSTSFCTWIPCVVTAVDGATGAVQIDQKPKYWLQGDELVRRLREAGPEPPIQGAAKGGAGRQLLAGALHDLGNPERDPWNRARKRCRVYKHTQITHPGRVRGGRRAPRGTPWARAPRAPRAPRALRVPKRARQPGEPGAKGDLEPEVRLNARQCQLNEVLISRLADAEAAEKTARTEESQLREELTSAEGLREHARRRELAAREAAEDNT